MCAAPGHQDDASGGAHGRTAAASSRSIASRARLARVAGGGRRGSASRSSTRATARSKPWRPRCRDAFDRVLVDAPCSGLGVLRRNPEVRWRAAARGLALASRRQSRDPRAAADDVEAGRPLVYSTCTLEPEENEDGGARLPAPRRSDFARRAARRCSAARSTPTAALRCLPHRHDTDGFFAVRASSRQLPV